MVRSDHFGYAYGPGLTKFKIIGFNPIALGWKLGQLTKCCQYFFKEGMTMKVKHVDYLLITSKYQNRPLYSATSLPKSQKEFDEINNKAENDNAKYIDKF